jgi:hypothetical protein
MPPRRKDRCSFRIARRRKKQPEDVIASVTQPGAGTTVKMVYTRNISSGGIPFLHPGFLHSGIDVSEASAELQKLQTICSRISPETNRMPGYVPQADESVSGPCYLKPSQRIADSRQHHAHKPQNPNRGQARATAPRMSPLPLPTEGKEVPLKMKASEAAGDNCTLAYPDLGRQCGAAVCVIGRRKTADALLRR